MTSKKILHCLKLLALISGLWYSITGIALFLFAFWSYTSSDVHLLLRAFDTVIGVHVLMGSASLCGLFMMVLGVLNVYCIHRGSERSLVCYINAQLLFMLSQSLAILFFCSEWDSRFKTGFSNAIKSYNYKTYVELPYESPPEVAEMLEFLDATQTRYKCCGSSGPENYFKMATTSSTKEVNEALLYPPSCCNSTAFPVVCQAAWQDYPTTFISKHHAYQKGCLETISTTFLPATMSILGALGLADALAFTMPLLYCSMSPVRIQTSETIRTSTNPPTNTTTSSTFVVKEGCQMLHTSNDNCSLTTRSTTPFHNTPLILPQLREQETSIFGSSIKSSGVIPQPLITSASSNCSCSCESDNSGSNVDSHSTSESYSESVTDSDDSGTKYGSAKGCFNKNVAAFSVGQLKRVVSVYDNMPEMIKESAL